MILESLSLNDSKPVTTPGVKNGEAELEASKSEDSATGQCGSATEQGGESESTMALMDTTHYDSPLNLQIYDVHSHRTIHVWNVPGGNKCA